MPTTMLVHVEVQTQCDHPGCRETREAGISLDTFKDLLDWMLSDGWSVEGNAIAGPYRVLCPAHAKVQRVQQFANFIHEFAARSLEAHTFPLPKEAPNQ
jgi:hypothetical protein